MVKRPNPLIHPHSSTTVAWVVIARTRGSDVD